MYQRLTGKTNPRMTKECFHDPVHEIEPLKRHRKHKCYQNIAQMKLVLFVLIKFSARAAFFPRLKFSS